MMKNAVGTIHPKTQQQKHFFFPPQTWQWRNVVLTSAAVALDIQLIDGWGHITEADAVILFTDITVHHVSWWCSIDLCKVNKWD